MITKNINYFCDVCGVLIKTVSGLDIDMEESISIMLCKSCASDMKEIILKKKADELLQKKREEASPEFGQNNTPINYCGSSPKRYFDEKISQEYEEEMDRIGREGLEKD